MTKKLNINNEININHNQMNVTCKYNSENIKLFQGDCVDALKDIPDKSIQLICIDPPYNIGKDTWDNIDNYVEWLLNIIRILETKINKLHTSI